MSDGRPGVNGGKIFGVLPIGGEHGLVSKYLTLRICLESAYFAETENFLLKVL